METTLIPTTELQNLLNSGLITFLNEGNTIKVLDVQTTSTKPIVANKTEKTHNPEYANLANGETINLPVGSPLIDKNGNSYRIVYLGGANIGDFLEEVAVELMTKAMLENKELPYSEAVKKASSYIGVKMVENSNLAKATVKYSKIDTDREDMIISVNLTKASMIAYAQSYLNTHLNKKGSNDAYHYEIGEYVHGKIVKIATHPYMIGENTVSSYTMVIPYQSKPDHNLFAEMFKILRQINSNRAEENRIIPTFVNPFNSLDVAYKPKKQEEEQDKDSTEIATNL